jgi:hypothetical protein
VCLKLNLLTDKIFACPPLRVPAILLSTLVATSRHAQVHFKQSSCTVTLTVAIETHVWSRYSIFTAMAHTKTSVLTQHYVSAGRRLRGTIHACWRRKNYIRFVHNDRLTQLQRWRQMERFIIRCQHVTLSLKCVRKIQSVGKYEKVSITASH